MSKNVNLDDETIKLLDGYKQEGESYSKVIKRIVAPAILTFGDLERALDEIKGPIMNEKVLRRVEERRRKKKC